MDKVELDEQEVTVEVVPQTVTEIVYLQDPELDYPDVQATNTIESYELNNIDIGKISGKSVVLDSSQTYVLLPTHEVIEGSNFINEFKYEVEDYNSGIGEFICTLCNFKCRSLSSLHSHRLIHNKQFIKCHYNCIACGQQFDKAQCLSHHFRTTHSKFSCVICKYDCSEECALEQHLKIHEPKKYPCDLCDSVFDTATKLVNHQKTHTTTYLYACNKCDISFATTAEVSTHLRLAHERVKLPERVGTSTNEKIFQEAVKVKAKRRRMR